eukprot:TRINITY_DN1029_c0_g1_i14.p1 TRINITY_DN1029_c0_g1~~TRINITY_DN1029_c0_g1_i14.p1  ORF type:complete len:292 (-),score=40.91 TRINITY_DN1029_c0_g1_i14:183-1058(-)
MIAMFLAGKLICLLIFALSMKSAISQTIFFTCLGAVCLISALLMNCISETPRKEPQIEDELHEALVDEPPAAPQSFLRFFLTSGKETLFLAFSKKMLMLLPFFYLYIFIRDSKTSLMPLLINLVMKDKHDRFTINRWTGYVYLCDNIVGIIVSVAIGFIIPILSKKIIIYITVIFSFVSLALLYALAFVKGSFGVEWFLISACLTCNNVVATNIQLCIFATDFPNHEKAMGAGGFINSISSVVVMLIFSQIQLKAFSQVLTAAVVVCVLTFVFTYKVELTRFTKKKSNPDA